MSAGLDGSLERPDTKRRNRTLSSLVNSSRLCHSQPMSWWLSVTSRYRTTFFSISTETSGRPHTSCSSCRAVSRESNGTGMIEDMPSLTAATYINTDAHMLRYHCLCSVSMQDQFIGIITYCRATNTA